MTKYLLYTSNSCHGCLAMKTALEALGVRYAEIKLYNGMILPPDVRSVPTLARETDGKRTTFCVGWPGSVEKLKKLLMEKGVSIPGKRRSGNERE